MKTIFRTFLLCLAILFFCNHICFSQENTHNHRHDSIYIKKLKVPKSKFWGNSTYLGIGFNSFRGKELDLNVGRSYGQRTPSGAGTYITVKSWGVSYSRNFNEVLNQRVGIFAENTFFYFPPIAWTYRAAYDYDFINGGHYITPSLGFSLLHIDLLYNYGIRIDRGKNNLKHGFMVRFKFYLKKSNWQVNKIMGC